MPKFKKNDTKRHQLFNPFVPNAPFLYTLNISIPHVFWLFQGLYERNIGLKWVKGVEKGCTWNKWVNHIINAVASPCFWHLSKTEGWITELMFCVCLILSSFLTLSWRRPISYRNQSTELRSKSMDWFLYDNGLRHERV